MRALVVGLGLVLASCSTSPGQTGFTDLMYGEGVSQMTMPDGTAGYLVNCDARGFEYCYTRAREICKGNFKVVNRTDHADEDEGTVRRIEMVCQS